MTDITIARELYEVVRVKRSDTTVVIIPSPILHVDNTYQRTLPMESHEMFIKAWTNRELIDVRSYNINTLEIDVGGNRHAFGGKQITIEFALTRKGIDMLEFLKL